MCIRDSLVPAPRLSARVGADVWLKVEGANPTGSFKDRGMTMAISMAVEEGAKAVVCASTGNTSASAAAYAAPVSYTHLDVYKRQSPRPPPCRR